MKLNKNTNFAKLSSAKFLILYCYIGIYIIVQILAKADNQVTIGAYNVCVSENFKKKGFLSPSTLWYKRYIYWYVCLSH